ncbi:hypothetical protein RN001_007000 [Aquatica leii]|uniref:Uncharacterized protein n=1 Tax=Aquatica leii TaxID=1421715 RepID=A0AAN7SBT0_9COLE|nr:hypothetical protein RN001_007000 [Aquatica leii]
MSIQGFSKLFVNSLYSKSTHSLLTRSLSRRSNNVDSPYKVIKTKKTTKDKSSLVWRDPNFELLASPSGFPFFLPGNISPAWYDKKTTVQTDNTLVMKQIDEVDVSNGNMICKVQQCPSVLRQTVCDLFPNNNLEACELSVVTITLKPDMKLLRYNKESETEKLAQTFVLTANNICDRLKKAGYWADFINPFSGRPYSFPHSITALYQTDEKFRCLDFQIFDINECKVISSISNKSRNQFVGSLFTNAPSNKYRLNNIFTS